jgi:DNA-binding IclR family transcriptional regulator
MRIDPKEKIAGVLISEVRKLLKSVDNELNWGKNLVKRLLDISPQKANRLLQELELRGYVERSRIIKREQLYRKTLKGSSLGLASAAKPVTRKTADRVFSEFIERVKKVNKEPLVIRYWI